MTEERLNPDELLTRVEREQTKTCRGGGRWKNLRDVACRTNELNTIFVP